MARSNSRRALEAHLAGLLRLLGADVLVTVTWMTLHVPPS